MAKQRTRSRVHEAPDLRSLIFIGDLARAFGTLKPTDDATARKIAEALGFEWRAEDEPGMAPVKEVTPQELAEIQRALEERRKREEIKVEEEKTKVQPSDDWLASVIAAKGKETGAQDVQLTPLPLERGDSERVPPPFVPLFLPLWTRAILSATLATESKEGPLDLERLIEQIARREELETVPRETVLTLRRGVQLLLDQSQAMLPYERDQQALTRAILNVMGNEKVQILRFAGCPSRKVWTRSNIQTETYTPPHAGTLVLVLSDLGLTHPRGATDWASVEEWSGFASEVKKAGCRLAALVPYAASRWGPLSDLRGLVRMIPWDRRTTAGLAQKFARGQRGGTG